MSTLSKSLSTIRYLWSLIDQLDVSIDEFKVAERALPRLLVDVEEVERRRGHASAAARSDALVPAVITPVAVVVYVTALLRLSPPREKSASSCGRRVTSRSSLSSRASATFSTAAATLYYIARNALASCPSDEHCGTENLEIATCDRWRCQSRATRGGRRRKSVRLRS